MATITTAGGTVSASAKDLIVTAGAGVALVVFLYWLAKREIKDGAEAVANFADKNFNPTKPTNLAYRAAGGVVKVLGGDPQNTFGTQLYDDVQDAKKALDPRKDTNLAYRGANALTQFLTGEDGVTVGTKVADTVDWFKEKFF